MSSRTVVLRLQKMIAFLTSSWPSNWRSAARLAWLVLLTGTTYWVMLILAVAGRATSIVFGFDRNLSASFLIGGGMVNEEKLNELRGDQLRKMTQSGLLPLIYAHLFSLSVMREIFTRQMQLGLMPAPQLVA